MAPNGLNNNVMYWVRNLVTGYVNGIKTTIRKYIATMMAHMPVNQFNQKSKLIN